MKGKQASVCHSRIQWHLNNEHGLCYYCWQASSSALKRQRGLPVNW